MELGATVCAPQTADCSHCPINADCQAFSLLQRQTISKIPSVIPPTAVKSKAKLQTVAVCVVQSVGSGDGIPSRFLLLKRGDQGLLAGLWEFPCVPAADITREVSLTFCCHCTRVQDSGTQLFFWRGAGCPGLLFTTQHHCPPPPPGPTYPLP